MQSYAAALATSFQEALSEQHPVTLAMHNYIAYTANSAILLVAVMLGILLLVAYVRIG